MSRRKPKRAPGANTAQKTITARSYFSNKFWQEGFYDVTRDLGWTPHYETWNMTDQCMYESGRLAGIWFKKNRVAVRPGDGRWASTEFISEALYAYRMTEPKMAHGTA